MTINNKTPYVPAAHFVEWLEGGLGRAEYFSKLDPFLAPAMISKMKTGRLPITFEYAVRLERAQKASNNPLKAEELMTFMEHRALYRYVTGQEPAPTQVVAVRRSSRHPLTQAEAHDGAA